jgi:hypothetical protein
MYLLCSLSFTYVSLIYLSLMFHICFTYFHICFTYFHIFSLMFLLRETYVSHMFLLCFSYVSLISLSKFLLYISLKNFPQTNFLKKLQVVGNNLSLSILACFAKLCGTTDLILLHYQPIAFN